MSLDASSDSTSFSEVEFFKATFEHAGVGLAHGSLNGTFASVNQKLLDMLGYTRAEMQNLSYDENTHPEDLPENKKLVNDLLDGRIQSYSIEKRYRRKDQSYLWIRLNVALGRDEKGKPKFFIWVIEDISKAKENQEQLKKIRQEIEADRERAVIERDQFFAISGDAMVTIGTDGFYRRVNPSMCRMLEYTESELQKIPIMEIVHPDDRARVVSVFPSKEQLMSGDYADQVVQNFEHRMKTKSGDFRTVSWNVTLISNGQGIFATGRDITKRMEQESVISMQKEQMAAASKMNALGRMAGGVAHEINNPLTIVYGQAFRLRKMAQENRLDRDAVLVSSEQIEKMSSRIVEIINGLRMFAREGSNDPMEFITLSTVLRDTLSFCQGKMKREGIELEIINEKSDLEICCRGVQISQVLLNILNNASDAIALSPHKTIRVRFIEKPEMVGLTIEDNGPGVPAEVVGSLFQPFFTTKPVGKGTGLGLSVAKGIIDSHGGKIFYSEVPGGGASFTMLFPRVE